MQFRRIMSRSALVPLLAVAFFGCQDKAAIQALQDLTTQLSETAKQQDEALAKESKIVEGCRSDLANSRKQPAAGSQEVKIEIPTAGAESTVAVLESFKSALTDTIERQKLRLEELKRAGESCVAELAAAKAQAKAAAAKTVSVRPVQEGKPVAVQKAEEAGTPTKGVRSRYKTKQ